MCSVSAPTPSSSSVSHVPEFLIDALTVRPLAIYVDPVGK